MIFNNSFICNRLNNKKIFFLIQLIIILHLSAKAQTKNNIIIFGKVVNENRTSLLNANIKILQTYKGITTDRNGFYKLTLKKKAFSIKTSYIGYYDSEKKISLQQIENAVNDTLIINFVLKPKIEKLNPINISSNKIETVYNKPKILLVDYEFYQDGLLLLIKKDKKFIACLVNDNDSILNELILNFKPDKFYRDCFNNIHVLNKDSVYQLYIEEKKISILYKNDINKFNNLILPCIASTDSKLIFSQKGFHHQRQVYYSINMNSKEKKLVKRIEYRVGEQYASDYYYNAISDYNRITPTNENKIKMGVWDGDLMHLNSNFVGDGFNNHDNRILTDMMAWYEKVASKPIYCPLFRLNGTLYLFDHVNDSIFEYNNNVKIIKGIKIDYHYKKGWANKIITNYKGDRAFSKFIKDGIVYLKEINLKTGKVGNIYKIVQQIYPEKIRIRDHYVYYLYNYDFNNKNNNHKKKLYRQKLE